LKDEDLESQDLGIAKKINVFGDGSEKDGPPLRKDLVFIFGLDPFSVALIHDLIEEGH